jgi:hypothetical protein
MILCFLDLLYFLLGFDEFSAANTHFTLKTEPIMCDIFIGSS